MNIISMNLMMNSHIKRWILCINKKIITLIYVLFAIFPVISDAPSIEFINEITGRWMPINFVKGESGKTTPLIIKYTGTNFIIEEENPEENQQFNGETYRLDSIYIDYQYQTYGITFNYKNNFTYGNLEFIPKRSKHIFQLKQNDESVIQFLIEAYDSESIIDLYKKEIIGNE